jgi:tRNA(fMet)-specific endonuclease VapC
MLRGRDVAYRRHHARAVADARPVLLSGVALFELWHGVHKSAEFDRNRLVLVRYLAGSVRPVAFDEDDAAEAGRLRALLERAGTPIGPYDLLIAAQASRRSWTLATGNVREFARVPGLAVEDWTA